MHRQKQNVLLKTFNRMSPSFSASRCLCLWSCFAVFAASAWGQPTQPYVVPAGGEFSVVGALQGDQINPALSLNPGTNYVVWEDNVIDKNGAGIGYATIDLQSGMMGAAKVVNKIAISDQIKPAVAQLQGGQYFFAWESKAAGTPDIYVRFMKNGVFYTSDVRVNTYIKDQQIAPVVTALADGGAIVAWSSYGQDGDMWGVYARKITSACKAPAREFQVAQTWAYNQRNPALATLANGNFVVTWTSENQRRFGSIDIYARIFDANGKPVTDEFNINSGTNVCSEPDIAATSDGGFTVVWVERDGLVKTNSLDILGRSFSSSGTPVMADVKINTFLYGDQYRPKIAAGPSGCLVIWTSLGQDGSREGVFGRYWLNGTGPVGDELAVNTTRVSQQIFPAVAWNGTDRFVVVWSSLAQGGFDLFGQAYVLSGAQ